MKRDDACFSTQAKVLQQSLLFKKLVEQEYYTPSTKEFMQQASAFNGDAFLGRTLTEMAMKILPWLRASRALFWPA